MIVENKEKVVTEADKIVFEMYDLIMKRLSSYKGEDCGAEIIYLLTHICAIFTSKMKMLLASYAGIFVIAEIPFDEWMAVIVPEYDDRLAKTIAQAIEAKDLD